MSITYEANLNCDGKDCYVRPVTDNHERPWQARILAKKKARFQDWVFIDDKHYCPECGEKFTQ